MTHILESIMVKDIMNNDVVTIDPMAQVTKAAAKMSLKDIGCLVVVNDDGGLRGMLTERDLVKKTVAQNRLPEEVRVKEAMNFPVMTASEDESVMNVAKRMILLGMKRFPVMSNGNLVGIVTEHDIVKNLPGYSSMKKVLTESIHDMFLTYKDGRLITHQSYSESSVSDMDMFAGMVSTLKALVSTALVENGEREQAFSYGNLKILIYRGDLVDLTFILNRDAGRDTFRRMRTAVTKVENHFEDVLLDWDGDVLSLRGVANILDDFKRKDK